MDPHRDGVAAHPAPASVVDGTERFRLYFQRFDITFPHPVRSEVVASGGFRICHGR
jgi:hypothetical protein